jgi:nucleotide-binding universal stress UspA family protein
MTTVSSDKRSEEVLWAIDPFETESSPDKTLIQKVANSLARTQGAPLKLRPVFVTPIPGQGLEDYIALGDRAKSVDDIRKVCDHWLQSRNMSGVESTHVVVAGANSRSEAVQNLLEFAQQKSSPYVLVSTHGRSGVKRLFWGSFAERLLHNSEIPVVVLTHSKKVDLSQEVFKRVLFPTDFSEKSKNAFLDFLKQAKRFGFEVTVFHSSSQVARVTSSSPQEEGNEWVKLAAAMGKPVTFILEEQRSGTKTVDSILKIAHQQEADLIALASLSGPFVSLVAGSVACEVVRANEYPVWIYGPKSAALESKS